VFFFTRNNVKINFQFIPLDLVYSAKPNIGCCHLLILTVLWESHNLRIETEYSGERSQIGIRSIRGLDFTLPM